MNIKSRAKYFKVYNSILYYKPYIVSKGIRLKKSFNYY